MDVKSIGAFHRARPFRPFAIRTASGESFLVEHPELFAFSPNTPVALLITGSGDVAMIDLAGITEITYDFSTSAK